jgi:Arylsulfatase A and related enzymes
MKRTLFIFVFLIAVIQTFWAKNKNKPNILVIITDDQTYESISSINATEVHTPNMDRLVKNGTTFTHAFNQGSWSGAVSVASRTMLITGANVMNAQKINNCIVEWARTVPDDQSMQAKLWGEVMNEAGYDTFITGKWHNTNESLLRSFATGTAVAAGFYETTDENNSKNFAYSRPNGSKWTPWNTDYKGHWSPRVKDVVTNNGTKQITESYVVNKHTSELFADEAISYLGKEHENPFFMYVAFNAPHDPRQSPKEFVDMYPQQEIKIPSNFLPNHPFDIGITNERDELLAPYPRTKEAVRLHRQEYYAIISHFDRELGRILDKLENSGQVENTYILFTSDHGLAVGMHGLMGKQNLYDHSIRMPLIIAGPGIKKNYKVDKMVYMQSLFATTCDFAGIKVPDTVDFQSLYPLLKDNERGGEKYIFGYFRHLQRMIRSEQYKLIVYPEINQVQLFDLLSDPYETINIADNPDYKEIKSELINALIEKQKELGDYPIINL